MHVFVSRLDEALGACFKDVASVKILLYIAGQHISFALSFLLQARELIRL